MQWLTERLEWFKSLRFGLMIHWGPYSQWGCIESWPLVEEDTWARPDTLAAWNEREHDLARFTKDYWKLNETFNPVMFNPQGWAELAKVAGMKYVCFTTKHHDGFCMYDSSFTDYKVTSPSCPFHSDPRADIVRQVFDAFRGMDFAISCYYSKSDWHHPDYWDPSLPSHTRNPNYDTLGHPEKWASFRRFVHQQIEELMTKYGRIDVLWLDAGQVRPPLQDLHMAEIAAIARRYHPHLLIADRTVGGEFENFPTPEQHLPDSCLGRAWESCITIGNSWSYDPNDSYKSIEELIDSLIDAVGKGGNLLLNIGPMPDGTLCPKQVERLEGIGKWMSVNGEAFDGTTAVLLEQTQPGKTRFMLRDDTLYLLFPSTMPVNELYEIPTGLLSQDCYIATVLGMSESIPITHNRLSLPESCANRPSVVKLSSVH